MAKSIFEEMLDALKDDLPEEITESQQLGLATSTSADGDKKQSDSALLVRLQAMLRQAKWADRRWRKRAQEGWEYYDGKQWSSEDELSLGTRKQAAVTLNRVAPTVDLVIGLQVTQPMDWVAKPVGLQDDGVAEAATHALKYISSQNNAFDVLVESYKDALIYGIGWIHCGFYVRNNDPMSEPVQLVRRDPRELRLDPKCKNKDISDARYLVWTRRVEIKDAIRGYPKLKKKLGRLDLLDENGDAPVTTYDGIINVVPPPSTWDDLDWNEADKEDIDPDNQTVYIHELYERVSRKGYIIKHRNGYNQRVWPEDITEDLVANILSPDIVTAYETNLPYIRLHIFSGDVLLESGDSPYDHGLFPFVPVWHKRDRFGDPLSMVEQIKDPQREINHRRSRLLWELLSNVFVVSQRALMNNKLTSVEEAEEKAGRPDAVWVADPGDITILDKPSTASAQFQLMQDSKAEIQSVSGINDDLMGMDSSSRSGKAKQITMMQGATIQRPKEANLQLAHKLCGEIVLNLIQQVHTEEWVARITDDAGADVLIPINQPNVDPETGQMRVLNDIVQARFDIAVQDAPWTPTQRDRAAEILTKMLETEQDPIMRQAIQQAVITVGDIPNKSKILALLNKNQEVARQNMAQQQQLAQNQQAADLQSQAVQDQVAASDILREGLPPVLREQGLAQEGVMT